MQRATRGLFLLAISAGVVAACGHKSSAPATLEYSADPQSIDNPWPDDRLFVGGKAGTPAGYFERALPDDPDLATAKAFLGTAVASMASNGGYSVYAPIVLPLSSMVSTAGLDGFHLYQDGVAGADVPVDVHRSLPLRALLVTPRTPLAAKTAYVLCVSSSKLSPSAPFRSAVAGGDAALAAKAAAAVARGAATSVSQIDLLTSFTTQPLADDLNSIQWRIDTSLGDTLLPSFTDPGGVIPNYPVGVFGSGSTTFAQIFADAGAASAHVASIAQGTWQAFDFRRADGIMDASLVYGTATTPSTSIVDFRLCIPTGTPPPSGWPIVLTSHGMTSDAAEAVARCSSFNRAGIALMGQTATDHGYRGGVLTFFDFTRANAVRDEFRQSDAEILQMQRMLSNAKAASIAPFDTLDTDHPHYWGNSLGSLFGGAVIATSTHLRSSGLSVPGGRLTLLFDGKAGTFLLAFFAGNIGMTSNDPRFADLMESFRILAQWAIDPADPAALAAEAPLDRKVLIQEALGDGTILNIATENLRAAYGVPVESAPVDPFTDRGAMWVWDASQYGFSPSYDVHNLYWDLAPMRHQMETWVLTDGTNLIAGP